MNASQNPYPTYLYKYDFESSFSYSTLYVTSGQYYGVVHADDLLLCVNSTMVIGGSTLNSVEQAFSKKWTNFLVDFAKYGFVE